MTASPFLVESRVENKVVQEKVYHPPPPGKGRDAKREEENGEASRAEPADAIGEQPAAAS